MLVGRRSEDSNILLWIAVAILSVLLIISLASSVYFYKRYNELKRDPILTQQSEQERVIERVQKLYSVPQEDPSIVQVEDPAKVKSQAFFKEAQKGDYVLLYQNAKLAILYREKTNKIINTGPISTDTTQQKGNGTTTQDVQSTQ
jgi:uncharacterized membrane protein